MHKTVVPMLLLSGNSSVSDDFDSTSTDVDVFCGWDVSDTPDTSSRESNDDCSDDTVTDVSSSAGNIAVDVNESLLSNMYSCTILITVLCPQHFTITCCSIGLWLILVTTKRSCKFFNC